MGAGCADERDRRTTARHISAQDAEDETKKISGVVHIEARIRHGLQEDSRRVSMYQGSQDPPRLDIWESNPAFSSSEGKKIRQEGMELPRAEALAAATGPGLQHSETSSLDRIIATRALAKKVDRCRHVMYKHSEVEPENEIMLEIILVYWSSLMF